MRRLVLGADCGLPKRLNMSGPAMGSVLSVGAPGGEPGGEWMEFDSEEGDPVAYTGPGVTGAGVQVDFNPLRYQPPGFPAPGPLLRANSALQGPVVEPRAGEYSTTLSFTLWTTTWGVPTSHTSVSLTAAGRVGTGGANVQDIADRWAAQLNDMGYHAVTTNDGKIQMSGEYHDAGLGGGVEVDGFITNVTMTMAYGFSRAGAIDPLGPLTPTVTVLP